MKAFKAPIRYMVLFLLFVAISASYGSYEFYKRHKAESEKWSMVTSDFKNCEMLYALEAMGYTDPISDIYRDNIHRFDWASKLREPLVDLLTNGVRDGAVTGLDNIWLDPLSIGSVGVKASSKTSIKFLDQCNQSIKNSNLNVWLDVGIYYLVIGHREKAIAWLNNAGDAGVSDAYVLLGHGYRNGLLTGVKDERSAFLNYTRAAEGGSVKGMLNVAEMVIKVDPESAINYLNTASRKGSLTAAYRLALLANDSIGSSSEKAAVGYFWALVFDALHNVARSASVGDKVKKMVHDERVAKIPERELEYPFDGIPIKPWSGYTPSKINSNKTVSNYSDANITFMIQRYEKSLSPAQRVQIQDQVNGWMKKFQGTGVIDTIKEPDKKGKTLS